MTSCVMHPFKLTCQTFEMDECDKQKLTAELLWLSHRTVCWSRCSSNENVTLFHHMTTHNVWLPKGTIVYMYH